MIRRPPRSTRTNTLFPYTTLFRSERQAISAEPRLIDVLEIVWGQFEAPGLASVERRHAGLQPLVGDMQVGQIGAIGRDAAEGIAVAFLLVEQSPRRIGSRQVYPVDLRPRSDEGRVGKECVSTCRSRWSPSH